VVWAFRKREILYLRREGSPMRIICRIIIILLIGALLFFGSRALDHFPKIEEGKSETRGN
jgi:hypothetical protein